MALSRLRIEAQKERLERDKKEREAQGLTIGQASQIRQEALKEKEAKRQAGIPESLPSASELRAAARNDLRTGNLIHTPVSRNATQNTTRNAATIQQEIDELTKQRDELRRTQGSFLNSQRWSGAERETSQDIARQVTEIDTQLYQLRKERDTLDYVADVQDNKYNDDFFGQFAANYRLGRINQDVGRAYNDWLNNDNEATQARAQALAMLQEQFQREHADVLDDEGWVRKTAAGYLPQFFDQLGAQAGGGALGFLAGGVGGARIGASVATSAQSLGQMQGAAFQALLAEGMDEETAREAARDEGFLSALIEGLGTYVSFGLNGSKMAITAAANTALKNGSKNAAVKAIAAKLGTAGVDKIAKEAAEWAGKSTLKKAGTLAGGALLNAGGEYLEEAAQQAVSIANKNRENTGKWDLTKEAAGVALDAITGKNTAARDEMHEAGTEGFKIGLMFGGTQTAVNAAVTQYANAKTKDERKAVVKTILEDKESLDALIQEGKETGSESAKIAGEIEGKTLRGETVTEKDVERLIAANDVYIQEEAKSEASLRHIEDSADGDTVDTEAAKATREALKPNYGEHGTKAFESIASSNNIDRNALMVRFDKPYQAGLTGLEMKDVELVNDFQREAYNAGRLDYIMRKSKDAEHTPGVIHSEEESGFDFTDAPKSLTQAEKNFANFYAKKMGVKGSWDGKNGNAEYNAFYDSSTGGVTFAQDFGIDPKLMERLGSEDFMKKVERLESERDGSFVFYVGHEIATHVAMNRAPAEMRAFVNAMYNYKQGQTTGENLARSKQTFYASKKVDLDTEGAIEEVVADTILELYNGDENAFMEAMYRIANGKDEQAKKGARTFSEMLNDIIRKLKAWARKLTGRENAEARAKAEQGISELEHLRDMFEQAIGASMKAVETARQNPGKQTAANVGEIKNSIKGFATAAGLEASRDANGKVVFKVDGKVVTKVTPAHIKQKSGLGGLITAAMENGFISDKEAEIQYKAASDIMNMIINTQDPEMVWAWVGSSMFSAIKSNADGQYGTTVDFTTVCRKTQDMITAMSKAMMKLKRGLTKDEVTKLQAELIAEGSSVPCPVCYVFSRWAGIGSVLDNMYRWQEKYDGYTDAQLNEQIATLTEKLGKGKARELAKLLREQDEEYDQLSFEKEKLALEKKQLTSKKKTAVKNNDARTLVDVNNRLAEIDKRNPQINKRMKAIKDSVAPELAWLLQVRTQPDYDTRGKVRANVLFNLDDAATFAEEFPLAWKYRTSRGPSAGKAILPYSDMRAGDIILGVGNTSADGNTAFANATGKFTTEQKAYVEKAIKRAKAQNLIGGQRFQSTSDFRYDYALDYLMAFWECQAIGSKMQTYTKIIEFGDMVAAVGGDFNLSVMPRNKGYITLPNGKNQLVFSSVTGIDFEAAKRSNEMHDNGQLILVGINDEHILAALEDSEETRGSHIGFVIPYHASGASINEFIRVLVSNLGETYMAKSYQDYSDVQSDKERKNATADQKRRNDLRTKLLRGKDGGKNWEPSADDLNFIRGESKSIVGRSFAELREIERKALRGDKAAIAEYESWTAGVLWDLYNKMWMKDGGEYGVRLNTAQAKAVMPHEYWNKTVNRDQAYINGFLFRSYCYNLGLTPRFTGAVVKGEKHGDFADSKGYWKMLIDRPMYRNDGTYRDQQIVNMSTFNQEMLKADYAKKNWEGYSVQEPDVARAARAAERFVESSENMRQYSMKITDKKLLDSLNAEIAKGEYDPVKNPDGGYINVYRSFQVIDGKLYAPMNAVDRDADGKNHRLGYNSQYKVWEMATESPEIAQRYMDAHPGERYAKFNLDGVDNATSGVAYNPYLHASNLVLNDQFSAAYRRNLITVECWVPVSEIGAYKAQYAKDATGWVDWKPGGVAGKLMKIKPQYARKLFVSRYMLPVREVKPAEVASIYKEYLDGTDIKVPWNVVTPELRRELVKVGVPIDYKDVKAGKKNGEPNVIKFEDVFPDEAKQFSMKDSEGNELSKGQAEYFKDSKARDKDGNLLVLYHGSRYEVFTEFDLYEGAWLTPDRDYARVYAERWGGWRGEDDALAAEIYADPRRRIYAAYANITKPLNIGEIDRPLSDEKVRQLAREMGVRYTELKPLADEYMEEFTYMLTRSNDFIELALKRGFDGLRATEDGRETWCAINVPEQVKLTSNKAPTSNPDIRFSLKDSEGNQLSKGQQEYFKYSKVRDDFGNLIRLYHGTGAFGFTELDFGKSDDSISFFMTDNPEVARSYSGTGRLRSVVKKQEHPERIDPHTASIEDVVDEYIRMTDRNVKLLATKDQLTDWAWNHTEWARRETRATVEMLENLRKMDPDTMGIPEYRDHLLEAKGIFSVYYEAFVLANEAGTADEMIAASIALGKANKDVIEKTGGIGAAAEKNLYISMLLHNLNPVSIAQSLRHAAKALYAAQNGEVLLAQGNDYLFEESALREDLENEYRYEDEESETNANYELYANLVNPLIIEGDGALWRNIHIPEAIRADFAEVTGTTPGRKTARTRDFAKYAKAKGYDGVIFRDIEDIGPNDWGEETSTVVVAYTCSLSTR